MFPLVLVSLVYLTLVFPFAYFRHDDWWALGNSLSIPENPAILWSVKFFSGDREVIWFFRPLFRLMYYLEYQIFGLHYYPWLFSMLAATMFAVWFGARAIERLGGARERARLFSVLCCANFSIHLGTLAWTGEGLMNCPQVLLLSALTFFFCRAVLTEKKRTLDTVAGAVCFLLALGFKESSVFHPVLLLAIAIGEPKLSRQTLGARARAWLPLGLLAAAFFVYRVGFLPLNPDYAPQLRWDFFYPALIQISGALGLPLVVLVVLTGKKSYDLLWRSRRALGLYFLFVLLAISPYLGHAFFSPGWLLYPGFFSTFLICLLPWPALPTLCRRAGILVAVLSLTVCGGEMCRVGWWQWQRGQRAFTEIALALPEQTPRLTVRDCPNSDFPSSTLHRVIGFPEGLSMIRPLVGKNRVPIVFSDCDTSEDPTSTAIVEWRFPEFSWIRKP